MKIVILDGYAANPGDLSYAGFEQFGEVVVYDRTKDDEIDKRVSGASIVITNKTPITKEIIEATPTLTYIGVLATGYNIVDVEAAKKRGVVVTNIPSYSTLSVAQLTMALLLEICHRVGDHSRGVHQGKWSRCKDFAYWDSPLIELVDKTIGIIGFGSIGEATGRLAHAFGMRVLAYRRNPPQEKESWYTYTDLDTLYKESDVISLHAPLTAETQNMINSASIAKMRDGVIILNTSRGALVNESDLAAALESGKVYASAVDVVTVEPIESSNPLLGLKNSIITPHIGWAPKEARMRLMKIAVENIEAFLRGEKLNVVS